MRMQATGGAKSGFGRKDFIRVLSATLLFVACAAPATWAEEAAGPPAPAPAAPGESPALLPAPPPGVAPAPGVFPAPGAASARGSAPTPSFRNDYALLLGLQYWDRIDGFDPAIPAGATGRAGRFEPLGVNIEGSYHRRVGRWMGWDALLGGDLGLYYHANKEDYDVTILPSGRRVKGQLSARGLYLTPSVKLFSGEPGPWRFSVGAGAGIVYADISNNLEDGMTVDTYFREESLGGYLSAGADRILSRSSLSLLLRLEAKVLFVDFGSLGEFAPGAGSLTGPIYLFQAGIAVAD